jgi:hypothetical protein
MAMMHSTCAIYVALLALSLTAMSPGRNSAGVEPAADGATTPIISTQYNPCSGGSCR